MINPSSHGGLVIRKQALIPAAKSHPAAVPSLRLKDLAATLGLSQSTVSRALNGAGDQYRISPGTQKRILEAAEQFNYAPNALAQQLRQKRSYTMGVIVPEISEGYAAAVLSGIEDALFQEKFFYFVVSHRHQPDLLREYPRILLARSVEGLIVVDTPLYEEFPVPVVSVSGHQKHKSMIAIELDHLSAARSALTHLLDLGHRKIAFIKGQDFSSDTELRWKSIRRICAELFLPIDSTLVVQLEGNSAGSEPGYAATCKLLARGKIFTALFAFNDLSAIGAMTALHEHGFQIPSDISIVGFDDIPAAATVRPSLTTVRQPLHNMGNIAAIEALRLIQGAKTTYPKKFNTKSIQVQPIFVERESTTQAPTVARHKR